MGTKAKRVTPIRSPTHSRHGRAVQAKARLAKDARGALRKAAGETDAVGNPLMQLLRRLRVAWSPSTCSLLRSKDYDLCGLDMI